MQVAQLGWSEALVGMHAGENLAGFDPALFGWHQGRMLLLQTSNRMSTAVVAPRHSSARTTEDWRMLPCKRRIRSSQRLVRSWSIRIHMSKMTGLLLINDPVYSSTPSKEHLPP